MRRDRNGNYRVGCYNFAECGRECCALHLAVKEIGGKPSGLKGRRHLFVLIDGEKNAPHGISLSSDGCLPWKHSTHLRLSVAVEVSRDKSPAMCHTAEKTGTTHVK